MEVVHTIVMMVFAMTQPGNISKIYRILIHPKYGTTGAIYVTLLMSNIPNCIHNILFHLGI